VLHPEVDAKITVNVARTQEEAEVQASGKTIAELRAEEEAAEQAEFDVQQLFDEDVQLDEEGRPIAHGMEVVDAKDDLET
jgi:large subunit ribosomal protein L9